MRMKAPKVSPAASAISRRRRGHAKAPGMAGQDVLCGVQVYTTKLNIVMDPRATYTQKTTASSSGEALAVRLGSMSLTT